MFASPGEAGRAFAGQRVLDHQLAGERQHERDDRDGNRPPHAVRRDHQRDAGSGAGVHVDRVVAHAETRHDGESTVGRNTVLREALGQQNERIEIGELLGSNRVHGLEIGELDAGGSTKGLEIEVGEDGRAVGFEEIARQGDAIAGTHDFFPAFLFPAFFGEQPSRNFLSASASASCSTQMSPE